jgi:PAS domain S-box-containing protein
MSETNDSDATLDELAAYVGFTAEDLERLRAAASVLEPHLPAMSARFYAAIEATPRAGEVLREGPKQVDQLKLSLQRWAHDLLTRRRDAVYAASRRRIGMKHVELGLDHHYVVAAIGVVREFLQDALARELAGRPEHAPTARALDRALDLDAALLTVSHTSGREEQLIASGGGEGRALRKIQSLLLQGPHHLTDLDEIRQVLAKILPVDQLRITRGESACVVRTGREQTVELHADGLRAVRMLPLWIDDRVIGSLDLATRGDARALAGHDELLGGVCDAIALAVARHDASLKLFDSEEQFRSLFDAVADGLYVVDSDQRYRAANQVFLRLLDRAREDVIGHPVDEVLPGETARRMRAMHGEVLATGRALVGEVGLETGDRRRWLSVSLAPVHSSSGATIALTAIARDVTVERERTAHQAHQHKMTSLGLLAAGIAHEVSNPLASIACIAQDLEETTADAESKDLLRRIVVSTQRASHSLQQVLRFVRPSSRDAAPMPLNDTVQQTLDMASFDPRARGLSFGMELAQHLPPVTASADDVSQVLLNLFLNALDAMTAKLGPPSARPPAPRLAKASPAVAADVTVRTWATDDQVHVAVEDRGPGIPPEQRVRIFEPFYTTKSGGRGTGLGLFVSAQIVRDLGGSIEVESTPGAGARFVVSLPRAP